MVDAPNIDDEDSLYTMILPDNEAWDKAYAHISPYFTTYNADEAVADSIRDGVKGASINPWIFSIAFNLFEMNILYYLIMLDVVRRHAARRSGRRCRRGGFVHGADQKGIGGGQLTAACSDETPGDFRLQ